MIRLHIKVSGRVQGVGFRFFTQQQAEEHHIKGWVKNTADGAVEIDAEGEEADIDRFTGAISKGPFSAKVKNVDAEKMEALQGYTSFSVRH